MRSLIIILLMVSFTMARDDGFLYGVKGTVLFRMNEDEKDFIPGIGLIGTFMGRISNNIRIGTCPEYTVWSLKFEDESVSYRSHTLGIPISLRRTFSIKNNLDLYVQGGIGPELLLTVYSRKGFSSTDNLYTTYMMTSDVGLNIDRFNMSFRCGFFKEIGINETFVYTGLSLGITW